MSQTHQSRTPEASNNAASSNKNAARQLPAVPVLQQKAQGQDEAQSVQKKMDGSGLPNGQPNWHVRQYDTTAGSSNQNTAVQKVEARQSQDAFFHPETQSPVQKAAVNNAKAFQMMAHGEPVSSVARGPVAQYMRGDWNKVTQAKLMPVVQRVVYFPDQDGAQAQVAKPAAYPFWESPLSSVNNSLHKDAASAKAAAEAAINVAGWTKMTDVPTAFSDGGTAGNGTYDFWVNDADNHVKGHPIHNKDTTNTLTKISKPGKKEVRGATFKPVVHDHAADYGKQKSSQKAWDFVANPGAEYATAAGAKEHYLQKP